MERWYVRALSPTDNAGTRSAPKASRVAGSKDAVQREEPTGGHRGT